MKIGVLGTGSVGTALAAGFIAHGHEVQFGTGHVDAHRDLTATAPVGTFAEAAAFGELLVFAVSWQGVDAVLGAIPADATRGKIVADTVNPLTHDAQDRPDGVAPVAEGSAAAHVAARLPHARVVKAWNTVGAAFMVDPKLPGGPPDMFVCGDDAAAKATIATLSGELGYPAFDVGPLAQAALLEHLAMLWISIAMQGLTAGHAFKLLRNEKPA